VHTTSPYYLDNTLFTPRIATQGLQMWEITGLQLGFFAKTYAGLFCIVLLICLQWLAKKDHRQLFAGSPRLIHPEFFQVSSPLLSGPINYFWFWFFWASVANILLLGRNPGNFMTYLFQLMSAPLIIASLGLVSKLRGRQRFLAPLVLTSLYQAWAILPKDFTTRLENWDHMDQLIAESDEILASQMLIATLMEHDKTIYQNGHTFYFPLAAQKPAIFIKDRKEDRVSTIWLDYLTDLYRKIETRKFDLILVSPWEMRGIFKRNPPPGADTGGKDLLMKFYEIKQRIPLSMTDRYGGGTYVIQVWTPRPYVEGNTPGAEPASN
jgi:hypothetical protein